MEPPLLNELLEIARWLLTLIVGGIIGGGIAFAWQRKNWLFQQKFTRLYETYHAQISVTRDIFELVDKRIFASRAYITALKSHNEDSISEERIEYRRVVAEWNEKSSGLVTILKSKFGSTLAYRFDGYFLPEFSNLDHHLRNIRLSIESDRAIDARSFNVAFLSLHSINEEGRIFMNELLYLAEYNKDILEQRPKISMENIDNLYSLYLIKPLFEPRKQI